MEETKKKRPIVQLAFVGCALLVVAMICALIVTFYHSLEEEVYTERVAYLKEITAQTVTATDAVASAQWNMAATLSNQFRDVQTTTKDELTDFLEWEEDSFSMQGLSLLAFDSQGNYYDSQGNRARWQGVVASITATSPQWQVEITTLPTTTAMIDEMVFVLRMDHTVSLEEDGTQLTHVAVVRDMSTFSENFQIPSFQGQGESYIVSGDGTKVYRGQAVNDVIGNVYNVLKPLENVDFRYGGSLGELRACIAVGESCSLEFAAKDGGQYYITTSPMSTNGWSLLSVVPSQVVSARMQQFMTRTLLGMGAIALVVIVAVGLTVMLVVRYRASQRLTRQQAKANVALAEAAHAAEAASRAKTVFLSHMSHDIRTPINGIMGMTDIAQRNMDRPEQVADCLKKIGSASRHLLSLVNDVLDMSRIESGKVQLEEGPINVDSVLDGCYSIIAGQALEKKIDLRRDFSGVAQPQLLGDELHLRQILINILGNAVKFTPEGGAIVFDASSVADEDGKTAELTVTIRDNGIGMSEEFQKRIFEPFAQAEDSGRSRYQGTGLGMSIVKQLLDLMGGTIELKTAPGEGSTFTVRLRLPIGQAPAPRQSIESAETCLKGLRVLLVEDNELNLEIAQYLLEDCGCVVTTAANGQLALDAFVERPERSFDVILMDVMMPVMDGLAATRAIRESGRGDAGSVPIVAMTANAYAEDRKATKDAGMDLHLAKPFERDELVRILCELRTRAEE